MRGTIRPRSEGSWTLQVYGGTDPHTGRRRQMTRTIRAPHTKAGRKQAEEELARLVLEVEGGGQQPAAEAPTVAELLDRWYRHQVSSWSPSTAVRTRRVIDRELVPAIGDRQVRRLRAIDLDDLYASCARRMAPASVRKIHGVIRSALAQAVRWEFVPVNVASMARPPKVTAPDIVPPSREQVEGMIDSIEEPWWRLYVVLSATTGARRSQLLAVRWSDIDLDARQITFARSLVKGPEGLAFRDLPKGGRVYRVALGGRSVALLREHRRALVEIDLLTGYRRPPGALLFCAGPDGLTPRRPDGISQRWRRTSTAHGLLGVRLHDLRHYTATELLAGGVDPVTVAGRLGHSTPSTTLRTYAAFVPARDQAAADLLDPPTATGRR